MTQFVLTLHARAIRADREGSGRTGIELFTSKVYFRSNSKTPFMRNSTRMRITLSVSPRLLLPAYFVIPVYALRVISPCHARFSMAARRRSRERDAGLRSLKSVEGSLFREKLAL